VSLRAAWARVRGSLRGRRLDHDLDDEVAFHLRMLADDYRRRGMTAADAESAARRDFGGLTQVKEAYRDQRSLPWLEATIQDTRYALRSLRRTPGFTLTALLMLALGIGSTTAVFSLVDALVLEGLPYRTANRLVVLGDATASGGPSTIGYETLDDIRARVQSLDALTAVRSWQPTLVIGGEAERLPAMRVSWNFFQMLGVRPALGRDFTPADDTADAWQVVMLSDALWRSRFAADPAAIGRTITMNDAEYRIVGVMPAGFEPAVSAAFYASAEMWAPLGYEAGLPSACRTCRHLRAVGRLREGVGLDEARAELGAIRQQLAAAHPTSYADEELAVVPLEDVIAGPIAPALYVLLGAVTFLLLIACANLANLLLSRAIGRDREFAVRGALGADRSRLVRQLLTESLVLSVAGGVLGAVVAVVLIDAAPSLTSAVPRLEAVTVDARVLAFAAGVSVLTGLLFGLLPAMRGSAASQQRSLAPDGRGSIGAASGLARRMLVAADVALALVLLAGAGLMIQTVNRLIEASPGFDPDRVLSLQFSLVGARYREDPAVVSFIDQAVRRVAALPGVEAAAVAGQIPLGGNRDGRGVHVEGALAANPADAPSLERYSVTPDYFRVMRIGLERGRLFTDADTREAPPVVLVSRRTARSLWPGGDPLGRRMRVGGGADAPWRTVIGIVDDVHHQDLTDEPPLQMYLPQAQFTDSFLVMTVRTAGDRPERLAPDVRHVIRQLDSTVPVHSVAPVSDLVARSYADRRFVMQLLGGFALVALVLAAAGLYGVVSYALAQRTREFGLRMALGATGSQIARLVLAGGAAPLSAGLLAGGAGAFVFTRWLDSLLFGVSATDPLTFTAAACVLLGVAAAAHLPAVVRARRVDPSVALRQD
jgi:putative ABC transport system permease protein